MNEFTEHDIIDAINVASLDDKVAHRKLIAPPYAAPGVDKKIVKKETGFRLIWGPAHLRDIPEYVNRGYKRTHKMCIVNNDFRDRIEPAMSSAMAYFLTVLIILLFFPNLILGVTLIFFGVNFYFHGFLPVLPREIKYRRTLFSILLLTILLSIIALSQNWKLTTYFLWEGILLSTILLVVTDMCGATNVYKTTITHWLKNGNYESHFNPIINPNECNGCSECLKVCPKSVLARSISTRKAVAVNPKDCMECLACVKQCTQKAIYNKKGGKLKNDVKSIPGLDYLMSRDATFLKEEERWVNAHTELQGEVKIVPSITTHQENSKEKTLASGILS